MKHTARILKTLICLVSLFSPATAFAEPETVYLVRHAEKMTGPGDVLLSEAGETRAAWLAGYFRDKGLTQAFSTPYNRTMKTAEIIVRDMTMAVKSYDPGNLPDFAASLKNLSGIILVVGHSNTTPALAGLLGGEPGTPIVEDGEYDRIYKIDFAPDGRVTTELYYSEPRFSGEGNTAK